MSEADGYQFDGFYLDARNRQLIKAGKPVPLNSKYFDVLLLLVSRGGELVEKQRIFDEAWNGVFVTDSALTQCIKDIRRQLGDDASNPRYIRTVPKHGYVFIGRAVKAKDVDIVSPSRTASSMRPYKFLDYYTEHDAPFYFGRQSEVETLCSQVATHRSFILHGRSGAGKSSLMRAGLTPRLKAEGHRVFTVRSFIAPGRQMIEQLLAFAPKPGSSEVGADLKSLSMQAARPGSLVVFLLDQFEEFFSLLDETARQGFVDMVAGALCDETPLRLVFALREDFLAEMSIFKAAIPEIFHHEYRLGRLVREQAALAITEPARAAGCEFEPELVGRILDDLTEDGAVDPPQLQIVCDRLFDARKSDGSISLASYQELGTAAQILPDYLDRVLRRFDSAELKPVKAILTTLISSDGRRLVLTASHLEARMRHAANGFESSRLLGDLIAARVIRCSRENGESWIELAHDFLTPEVARWLGKDDRALKEARGVMERAAENHRSHQLLIDADALDLLIHFGEALALTGEEADLLITSLLHRGRPVPDWLIKGAPGTRTLVSSALNHENTEVRASGVKAWSALSGDEMKEKVRALALYDQDFGIRKVASIALIDRFPDGVELISADEHGGDKPGLVRRAISLAMVRDHDKKLASLGRLPRAVSALVVLALMWVRLRRGRSDILKRVGAGVAGGGVSGLIGALMLAAALATAQQISPLDAVKLVLVFASLGSFLGAVGSLGVSAGIVLISHIACRHSRWWQIIGGAAGGAAIGGVFKLLTSDILRALFGYDSGSITGAFEGAVLGSGTALGVVIMSNERHFARFWRIILGGGLGAAAAGIALALIGGNLFSGSLEIVAQSFAESRVGMEPLAALFGELHFGRTTQIILGGFEGLLFGAGVTAGLRWSAIHNKTRRVSSN